MLPDIGTTKKDAQEYLTFLKKRDVAQHLYDAYAAALTCHSPDDDYLKRIAILHDELQNAMKE
ncbi:hypothetical protein CEXT_271781, partial [Caerostris extrusa]